MFGLSLFSIIPALISIYIMNKWVEEETSTSLRWNGSLMLFTSAFFIGSGLVLRMDNLTNFALIGGALVQQTSPNSITLDEAVSAVQAYVRKVQESNVNGVVESFEEQPILSQGTQTRLYGAYYPNQYHDNANWMQLTIIFPQPGSVDGGLLLNNDAGPTATPDPDGDEISGYFPFDGFQDSHLEVFVTPTPEPDSAAMEP